MLANPTKDFVAVSQSLSHPNAPRMANGLRYDVLDAAGNPRPGYEGPLRYLQNLRKQDLRALDEQMEATLREMGVTYGLPHGEQAQPWFCDVNRPPRIGSPIGPNASLAQLVEQVTLNH